MIIFMEKQIILNTQVFGSSFPQIMFSHSDSVSLAWL